jgi:hypothetical protein
MRHCNNLLRSNATHTHTHTHTHIHREVQPSLLEERRPHFTPHTVPVDDHHGWASAGSLRHVVHHNRGSRFQFRSCDPMPMYATTPPKLPTPNSGARRTVHAPTHPPAIPLSARSLLQFPLIPLTRLTSHTAALPAARVARHFFVLFLKPADETSSLPNSPMLHIPRSCCPGDAARL